MDRRVDCRRGSVVGNLEVNDRILQPGPDSNLVKVPSTWRLRWNGPPVAESSHAFVQIAFGFIFRVHGRRNIDRGKCLAHYSTQLLRETGKGVVPSLASGVILSQCCS